MLGGFVRLGGGQRHLKALPFQSGFPVLHGKLSEPFSPVLFPDEQQAEKGKVLPQKRPFQHSDGCFIVKQGVALSGFQKLFKPLFGNVRNKRLPEQTVAFVLLTKRKKYGTTHKKKL